MKQAEMMILAPQKLKEIEKEYGIRILYAAESGSRAWGTNHTESDFDVRFIYIRPKAEYLRLQPHRDTLEFPISEGWDMCGWDLTKTLKLLHNANRQIFEWFGSPLVYVDDGFSQRFRPVLDEYFSAKTALYHYLHQADLNTKEQQKAEPTKIKHYLYRLQHLAAARWVLEHRMPAPVSFRELTPLMPSDIRQDALDLLEQKTTHPETPLMTHSPVLDLRLQEERDELGLLADQLPKEPQKGWEMLDQFFLSELERI